MPGFCPNWPFFSAGPTAKALVFMLFLIAPHIIVGGKTLLQGRPKSFQMYLHQLLCHWGWRQDYPDKDTVKGMELQLGK